MGRGDDRCYDVSCPSISVDRGDIFVAFFSFLDTDTEYFCSTVLASPFAFTSQSPQPVPVPGHFNGIHFCCRAVLVCLVLLLSCLACRSLAVSGAVRRYLRAGTAPQRLRLQNIAVARTGTFCVPVLLTRSWWQKHVLQMCWAAVPPLPPC